MRSLYACIEINRKINEVGNEIIEKINYYKTKEGLYGIEIIKENNISDKEVSDILQITEDEREIDSILDKLVSNVVVCNFEEIINDLIINKLCTY